MLSQNYSRLSTIRTKQTLFANPESSNDKHELDTAPSSLPGCAWVTLPCVSVDFPYNLIFKIIPEQDLSVQHDNTDNNVALFDPSVM